MKSRWMRRLQRLARTFCLPLVYCWLVVCALTALHLTLPYEPLLQPLLAQDIAQALLQHKRGFWKRSLSLSRSALQLHQSGREAELSKALNVFVEGSEVFVLHWKTMVLAAALVHLIGRLSDLMNLQIPLLFQSFVSRVSSIVASKHNSEPPPLEDVTYLPSVAVESSERDGEAECRSAKREAWMVFDPVFGVIPQETKELWDQQEEERAEAYEKMLALHRQRPLPPVRGF